jgi:hypothetical protein
MNLRYYLRRRKREQIVVAGKWLGCIVKPLATKIRLDQLIALNHRTHRAVQKKDALGESGAERVHALIAG